MQMNKEQTGLRSRKGISIMEVIIALVVIAIVSAATTGMVLSSVSTETQFLTASYVENNVESVLACFQFADDADTFYAALQKLGDFQRIEDNTYTYSGDYITVTVVAEFSPEKSLDYTVKDKDKQLVYTFQYPYEGGGAG